VEDVNVVARLVGAARTKSDEEADVIASSSRRLEEGTGVVVVVSGR
jgi:hypothetical protein